jgi:hypothetical protein
MDPSSAIPLGPRDSVTFPNDRPTALYAACPSTPGLGATVRHHGNTPITIWSGVLPGLYLFPWVRTLPTSASGHAE